MDVSAKSPPKAEKLKAALSRIQTKLTLNLPLTEAEASLAYEADRITRLNLRVETSVDGNSLIVKKTGNAQPVIDSVKYRVDQMEALGGKEGKAGQHYLGSIDPITANKFRQECGAGIGTQEFQEYALKRLDDDYTKFRAKDK